MLMSHVNGCHGNHAFFIVQMCLSMTQEKMLCISGVPMNDCPGGFFVIPQRTFLAWMPSINKKCHQNFFLEAVEIIAGSLYSLITRCFCLEVEQDSNLWGILVSACVPMF